MEPETRSGGRPTGIEPVDTSRPVVALEHVSRSYPFGDSEVRAVRDIDLVLTQGEFTAISGPSGSGKTTLCNLIALLDTPSSGTVRIFGQPTGSLDDDQLTEVRNRRIGVIFQSFNLLPVLSALENVALPLQIRGVDAAEAAGQARDLLIDLGLEGKIDKRPAKLSGGEQQRVAIARALITKPALVVADEPSANLDSRNAIAILEMMRDLNLRLGTAFAISTHDQRLVDRTDRQILLRDGAIVEDRRGRNGTGDRRRQSRAEDGRC